MSNTKEKRKRKKVCQSVDILYVLAKNRKKKKKMKRMGTEALFKHPRHELISSKIPTYELSLHLTHPTPGIKNLPLVLKIPLQGTEIGIPTPISSKS